MRGYLGAFRWTRASSPEERWILDRTDLTHALPCLLDQARCVRGPQGYGAMSQEVAPCRAHGYNDCPMHHGGLVSRHDLAWRQRRPVCFRTAPGISRPGGRGRTQGPRPQRPREPRRRRIPPGRLPGSRRLQRPGMEALESRVLLSASEPVDDAYQTARCHRPEGGSAACPCPD